MHLGTDEKAEFQYKTKPAHITKQFKLAEKSEALVGVVVGEEEIASKTVRIKPLGKGEHSNGEVVSRAEMVQSIKDMLKNL